MSQAGIINTTSGPVPPSVPTSFVTDSGTAVPAANILNVITNDTTANNANGIQDTGSGNTVTIFLTNRFHGSGTTVGATTADLVTFALGATPATYIFEITTAAFNPSTPAGAGYKTYATIRTTGVAGTLIDDQDSIINEDAALVTSDDNVIVSGNNAIFRVTGVVGLTIDWVTVGTYVRAI